MKKRITVLLCATCILASAIAQSVRIGNLEFTVRKAEPDTVAQVVVNEPFSQDHQENNKSSKPKPKFTPYHKTQFFAGVGAIFPDESGDYYTALGGKSINIDAGWIHCNAITRWFSLGGTLQYSYYNYKLRDAAGEPKFAEVVTGKDFAKEDIRKQTYRSHNIAASAFTRFYLMNHYRKTNPFRTMYIDLGAQGDFALYKFYTLNTYSEGKNRYHDDYAFNPFNASAFARLGFGSWAVFARYRFTDAFNSKVLPMDLPPLTIGIQIF